MKQCKLYILVNNLRQGLKAGTGYNLLMIAMIQIQIILTMVELMNSCFTRSIYTVY